MNIKRTVILTLAMAASVASTAQRRNRADDTVISGATIEIIQSYKPEVEQPPKPELTPTLPPIDTTTPVLNYTVPEQTLYYTYSSLPLRPLALSVDSAVKPLSNYLKLGGGNLSTIYLDAGITALHGADYETGIHVQHLSQNGGIKNQKVSLTGLNADGTLHKNGKAIRGRFGVSNNAYHFYGYDHAVYNYDAATVRQSYTTISLGADLTDEREIISGLTYHPSVDFSYFKDKSFFTEANADIIIPFTYYIDSNFQVYINAAAKMTFFSASNGSRQTNSYYYISPGLQFKTSKFYGHAAIAPTWGSSGKQYILPDLKIHFTVPETQLMMFAGWKGELTRNNNQQLTAINPYIYTAFPAQQTASQEAFVGVKSNVGSKIAFSGRVSWWNYNNLPVFINDTATDKKQFIVLYDNKVNAISLQASIRYQVAEVFSLGFSGQWFNFYNKTFEQVWHRPGVRFTGDILAQPTKKLTITGYVSFIDELYALEVNNRTFKLNALLDIGAGAEYEVIKRVNLFVQANNLLNNDYQRWYGYNAYGMNIFGGARLKF
ncbi:MAG: hypothetical protein H6551_08350 [Chitinophagales bacterium]|nr:hypothetical protein [Chitinophagaceae bacterium]MCB9065133.1 hypothetical protein [Chitinophagales bacterium]